MFLKDMLTLYPGQSYVQNIGFDSNGTHCKSETDVFKIELNNKFSIQKIDILESEKTRKMIEIFLNLIKPSIITRVKSKIIRLFK